MDSSQYLSELSKPFSPVHVTWKPGATTKDKTKALGMAYADLRAYQNRLDEVCGLDWSVTYTGWSDRIICHLTIAGVTRSSTGEPDAQSEKSEIAGTAAEAQSFKRACAMFGLGRYLYALLAVWAEYDADKRAFTDVGKAKLEKIVADHYRRHAGKETPQPARPQPQRPQPAQQTATVTLGDDGELRTRFYALGQQVYGDGWEAKRMELCNFYKAKTPNELTTEQVRRLIVGFEEKLVEPPSAAELAEAEPVAF